MKNHCIYSQQLWLSEWMRECRNKRKWRKCFCFCSGLRVNGNELKQLSRFVMQFLVFSEIADFCRWMLSCMVWFLIFLNFLLNGFLILIYRIDQGVFEDLSRNSWNHVWGSLVFSPYLILLKNLSFCAVRTFNNCMQP